MKLNTLIFALICLISSGTIESAQQLRGLTRSLPIAIRLANRQAIRYQLQQQNINKQIDILLQNLKQNSIQTHTQQTVFVPEITEWAIVSYFKKTQSNLTVIARNNYIFGKKMYQATNKLFIQPLKNNAITGYNETKRFYDICKKNSFSYDTLYSFFNKIDYKKIQNLKQKMEMSKSLAYRFETSSPVRRPKIIEGRSRLLTELIFGHIEKNGNIDFLLDRLTLINDRAIISSIYNLFNLAPQIIQKIDEYFKAVAKPNSKILTMKDLSQVIIDHIDPLEKIFKEPVTPYNSTDFIIKYITHHYNEIYYHHEFNQLAKKLGPQNLVYLFKAPQKVLKNVGSIFSYVTDNYNTIDYKKAFEQFCIQLTTHERLALTNFYNNYTEEAQQLILQTLAHNNLNLTWDEFLNTISCPWKTKHYSHSTIFSDAQLAEIVQQCTKSHKCLPAALINNIKKHCQPRLIVVKLAKKLLLEDLDGHIYYLHKNTKEQDKKLNEEFEKAYEIGGLESKPITVHDIRELLFKEIEERKNKTYKTVSYVLDEEKSTNDD